MPAAKPLEAGEAAGSAAGALRVQGRSSSTTTTTSLDVSTTKPAASAAAQAKREARGTDTCVGSADKDASSADWDHALRAAAAELGPAAADYLATIALNVGKPDGNWCFAA